MKSQFMPCPFCKSIVEINIDWAIRNGRVFCNGCCKAFDIRVGEEEDKETPPPIPSAPKTDKALEDIERELEEELDNNIANFDWEHF